MRAVAAAADPPGDRLTSEQIHLATHINENHSSINQIN